MYAVGSQVVDPTTTAVHLTTPSQVDPPKIFAWATLAKGILIPVVATVLGGVIVYRFTKRG